MLKTIATVFGVIMLAVGALGFVPAATANGGMLLGTFQADPVHNVLYLLTGAAALYAGLTSVKYSRLCFQAFGVIYGVLAVLGFVTGDGAILGMISNHPANNWLHVIIAVVSLAVGFAMKEEGTPTTVSHT